MSDSLNFDWKKPVQIQLNFESILLLYKKIQSDNSAPNFQITGCLS